MAETLIEIGVSRAKLLAAMDLVERKAWDALARYKYWMFGYHAAQWVQLKNLGGLTPASPFAALVDHARGLGFGPDVGGVLVLGEPVELPELLAFMDQGRADTAAMFNSLLADAPPAPSQGDA